MGHLVISTVQLDGMKLSHFINQLKKLKSLSIFEKMKGEELGVMFENMEVAILDNLEMVCIDLSDEWDGICEWIPSTIEVFWIPHCLNSDVLIDCIQNGKLSKLKKLESFEKSVGSVDDLGVVYENLCFGAEVLRVIGDGCRGIEWICLDVRLD